MHTHISPCWYHTPTKTLYLPNIFSACSSLNIAHTTAHWLAIPAIYECVINYYHSQYFTLSSRILLTNYGKILVYVLCQVSIHYLPMKDILKQFRHCELKNFTIIFLCLCFIFKFRQFYKIPTICSLIFGSPTFSSMVTASGKKCRLAEK